MIDFIQNFFTRQDIHKIVAFVFCCLVLFLIIWLVKWLSDQQLDDYQRGLDQANDEYAHSYHKPRAAPPTKPTITGTLHTAEGGRVVHMSAHPRPSPRQTKP
jgi:hypothetical protein